MRIPETSHAGEALRSAHAQSSRKRPVTVVATFLLATAFVFAGAPTATAGPESTDNHTQSDPLDAGNVSVIKCEGRVPGLCPF